MSNLRVKERSESLETTAIQDEMEFDETDFKREEEELVQSQPQSNKKKGAKKKKEDRPESEGYDSESERLFSNHLLHIVSALGGRDVVEDKYVPGDEAIGLLFLKGPKFLRMDEEENNEDKPAQNLLAKWNILSTDLLPLLVVSVENSNWKLAILTCEILVPLTWPVKDPTKTRDLDRVRTYKPAFLKPGVWSAIIRVILHLSSTPYNRRSENDHARLHLIISLIRNVLAINDFHDSSIHASNQSYLSATCQEELVARMTQEDVIELLLSLAASTNEFEYRPWNTLLLEIFFYIFQYRTVPDLLVPNVEKQKSALHDMMAKEALKRKPTPSRHSRFGGTFSLKTSQGQVNVRTVDKFKNAGSHAVSISKAFDAGKKSKADGRNKPIDIFTEKLLVMGSSKKIFREVANGFLENCFTNLFTSVKKDFDIDRKGLEETDYLHFFSVFSFFLEFHLATHENEEDLDNVTGMIDHTMTVLILKRATMYREEKNYKALYFTARSLQYFLGILKRMDKCVDEGMRQASLSVQSQFFYESAHISCVLNLARDSKPRYWRFLVTVADCIYTMGELMNVNFGEKGVAVTNKRVGVAESDEEDFSLFERIYTLDTFYKQCAYESIIDTYCYLLQHFEHLPDKTVTHIADLFEIISRTDSGCNLAPLFYTTSTFHTFHYFLSSPVSRAPVYEPLKNVIRFICAEAINRVIENPYMVIDFLFSKTRSDCNRLLGNEDDLSKGVTLFEVEPEDEMTEEDLEKEFGLPTEDEELRGEKIRKLSKWITRKSTDNADCIRWLASAMRIVLYEDFDDMLEEDPSLDRHTATLSQFIYMPSAPYFVNEFLVSKPAILLLNLLNFIPVISDDTYRFPPDLDIDLIEHVERAKLFTKRYIPPPNKGRKKKAEEEVVGDETADGDTSDQNENETQIVHKKKKKSSKRRSHNSQEKSLNKEKEGLRIKSAQFVLDSSDDENDEAFFKAEAALRLKRDLLASQGILSNGTEARKSHGKKSSKQPKLKSNLDSEDSEMPHSEEENERDNFRVGIEVEQETLKETQDQQMSNEAEYAELSSQQKLIKKIMGDTEMNLDSDSDDIENQIVNSNHSESFPKKKEQQLQSSAKESPAVGPLKKRARVIMDSDSD